MEFGSVSPEDHPEVVRLLEQCGLPTGDVEAAQLHTFIGARKGATLVGVVGIQPLDRTGLLRSLAVAPAHRGLGIGARLCDEAESLARGHGIGHLYLLTTTAASWFTAHGYLRLERSALPDSIQQTDEFRQLCPASAMAMHKQLSGAAA